MKTIRIGTRGSPLALIQAELLAGKIKERFPTSPVETVSIKTEGDRLAEAPLSQIGGKGIFIKEIEEALLARRVDLAIHSLKDLQLSSCQLTSLPDRYDVPFYFKIVIRFNCLLIDISV